MMLKQVIIVLLGLQCAFCIYNFTLLSDYESRKDIFFKGKTIVNDDDLYKFLENIVIKQVSVNEREFAKRIIRLYIQSHNDQKNQEFMEEIQIEQAKKILEKNAVEKFINDESTAIYKYLIQYFGLEKDIDEAQYLEMVQNPELYNLTLEAYLIATGNLKELLDTPDEDSDEILRQVEELKQEFDSFEAQFLAKQKLQSDL